MIRIIGTIPIRKKILSFPLIAFLAIFLFSPKSVFAVSVTISNTPATISEESFSVNVQISGAQAITTNYLRVDLYTPGTTNYFGYTFNGSNWYSGSDHTQFFMISIDDEGSWEGTVQGKVDLSSSKFKGSGDYNLKVRRYTAGGGYTWSNEVPLVITSSTSTPTSTLTPTPTPTTKPTPTPTPKPAATAKPNPSPTTKPTILTQTTPGKTPTSVVGEILGEEKIATESLVATEEGAPQLTASPTPEIVAGWREKIYPKALFIFGGLTLLSGSIIFLWKKRRAVS